LFDPGTGTISGVPQYAGTYVFRVMVTDASGTIASKVFSIVVNTDIPPFSRLFTLAYRGGPVLLNPHVAIVLVDPNSGPSWWSPDITISSSEPGTLFGAVSNLVTKDYSSDYGTPLSTYTDSTGNKVGRVSLCSYTNGNRWFGPVQASSVPSPGPGTAKFFRNQVIPLLDSTCSSDVTNTVFLMLYAPIASKCSDLNSITNDTSQGIHQAWVRLFDQGNNCPFMPSMQFEPTALQASVDFATFAVTHELNEGITDPLGAHNSWLALGLNASGSPHAEQIADWCANRNAEGATTYAPDNPAAGPYFNYTKDSFGTVVSAYMSTDGEPPRDGEVALCTPDVSTGIPPG
jgi:hypothetical protein